MSKLKKHISSLFIFYVLSLGLIGISWKYGLIELSEKSGVDLKVGLDGFENVRQVYDDEHSLAQVEVLNPALRIHYSTDGGETFNCSGSQLNLDEIENEDWTLYPTSLRWMHPFNSGPKLRTVVAFCENVNTNKRSDFMYFTSLNETEIDLPIINLTVKKGDLFNDLGGLLVLGEESWNQSDYQQAWWFRDANFTQRGRAWEKAVHFQYFEEGELKHEQNCGLRISGNATRGFPQKSFRLYARKDYGEDKFKHKFFGKNGQKKYESLVLRMSGNDNNKTMFADHLMHELAEETDLLVQKSQAAVLFINGNYWGIYNLRERIDEYFIAKYSNCKKSEVTILEDGVAELKVGSEIDQEDFLKLIDEVRETEQISNAQLDEIANQIHMKSYMDYIFFETFFANNDWPDNNAMCYKTPGKKWKWLLNDLDYSLAYPGAENVDVNMFDRIKTSSSVHVTFFNAFIQNETFKKDFIKRCKKNMTEHLSDDRIQRKYIRIKELYEKEIPRQIERWRNIKSVDVWEKNCEANLQFLLKRKEIYNEHLEGL